MKQACAISLSLLLLLAAGIEGMVTSRRNKCSCPGTSSRRIHLSNVDNFEAFPATSSCNQVEYIVTQKRPRRRVCLDPTLPDVQKLYKQYQAYKKTHDRRPMRAQ